MKSNSIVFGIFCLIAISACGGRPQGTTYNPGNRNKFASEEEKEYAIAQKKSKASGLLLGADYANAIKLNIMVPKVDNNYPFSAAQALTSKMLQITASNGIAGYGGDPSFVFAAIVNPIKEGLTNTAPQKHYINCSVTFYVANIHSGDVFGVLEQEIMGVGASSEQATVNAMQNVSNNEALAKLLRESSTKIVDWFEGHTDTFVSQVNNYIRSGAYDKAYGLLASVPEEASNCFSFAQKNINTVHDLFMSQMSNAYYTQMKDAIAKSEGKYNPEVGALLKMIPDNTPAYAEAESIFNAYVENVIDNANRQKVHDIYMEEEAIAIEKFNAEAEVKAQEALMMQMASEEQQTSYEEESFGSGFIDDVGNGIKTMLVDKAESLILGGVSNLLSFI